MKIQSASMEGLNSTRHSRAEAPKSPILRRLRDAVRVDPGMTAADRRKLSRHRIWCGEARTGLVSKLRRRLMSLGAGSRVGASPKTPDGYARESSRRAKSDPWCHLYDYMAHHDRLARAISAFLGLSAHRARHSWQSRGQAQPAGIGACSGALAGS